MISADPTPGLRWFSARIRFAHLATGSDDHLYSVSAYLVLADDFEDALPKALARGRREERTYANGAGGTSRTALVVVETLDVLDAVEDGVEVACLWSDDLTPNPFAFDHPFHPEESKPGHSL
ncbi:DUF4288 domain-containing protein [Kitasatospora sp. NPDC096147]|uniref:DUF4288 domain-containing protein n=1 Tax=Kitasatospora sp. NPDC096147 TaxID=3364093 RepID=UPI0038302AE5